MEEIIYWIWLSILDLSPIKKIRLIELFKRPSEIYSLRVSDFKNLCNGEELVKIFKSSGKIDEAKRIFEKSKEENIKIIRYIDNEYPSRLLEMIDFPILIYVKGNIELLNSKKTVSIVGSRDCTEYGMRITERLSYLLSKKNYTIISGMAKGIDYYAHMGALKNKGKTIAVLGCGVNYIYPMENKNLYYDILNNNGTIVSEYPLKTRPCKLFFPMRNRIIAGISDKVLVTEARHKSGSIITANLALEQGKNIYAIPGNITSIHSQGTNELLKDGAILVTTLEDIIEI